MGIYSPIWIMYNIVLGKCCRLATNQLVFINFNVDVMSHSCNKTLQFNPKLLLQFDYIYDHSSGVVEFLILDRYSRVSSKDGSTFVNDQGAISSTIQDFPRKATD